LVTTGYVYVNAGTIFTGQYEKNPIFSGTGKSRTSLAKDEPGALGNRASQALFALSA
jgi:hypothetical protein